MDALVDDMIRNSIVSISRLQETDFPPVYRETYTSSNAHGLAIIMAFCSGGKVMYRPRYL